MFVRKKPNASARSVFKMGQVGGKDPRWTDREQLLQRGVPIAAGARARRKKRHSKPASGYLLFRADVQAKTTEVAGRCLKEPEVDGIALSQCASGTGTY